jgi:FkbM family methyltransferase
MFGIGKKIKFFLGLKKNSKPSIDSGIDEATKNIQSLQKSASIYLGNFQALTRLHEGTRIFVDTRDISVSPHILLTGEWEMDITFHWKNLIHEMNPNCIFDIGSNSGYFGLLAASQNPAAEVHFFEANPRLASLIRKSVAVNGFGDRTSVVNAGVCDTVDQDLYLNIPGEYLGSGSLHANNQFLDREDVDAVESVVVKSITLDRYCSTNNIVPQLLKIDVEGFEEQVIKGGFRILTAECEQVVFLEYTPKAYSGEFFSMLSNTFKTIQLIDGFHLQSVTDFRQIEAKSDWSMLILRR